eukprot:8882631-Karenia_brevis.AAC.1
MATSRMVKIFLISKKPEFAKDGFHFRSLFNTVSFVDFNDYIGKPNPEYLGVRMRLERRGHAVADESADEDWIT